MSRKEHERLFPDKQLSGWFYKYPVIYQLLGQVRSWNNINALWLKYVQGNATYNVKAKHQYILPAKLSVLIAMILFPNYNLF